MLLGEILIRKKWISNQQLKSTLVKQKENPQKIGNLLLKFGLISGEQLQRALQEQYWRQNGYWLIGAMDRNIDLE